MAFSQVFPKRPQESRRTSVRQDPRPYLKATIPHGVRGSFVAHADRKGQGAAVPLVRHHDPAIVNMVRPQDLRHEVVVPLVNGDLLHDATVAANGDRPRDGVVSVASTLDHREVRMANKVARMDRPREMLSVANGDLLHDVVVAKGGGDLPRRVVATSTDRLNASENVANCAVQNSLIGLRRSLKKWMATVTAN